MTRRKPTNIRMALTKRARNGSRSGENTPGMGDDDPTNGEEESKKGASTQTVMILLCKIFLIAATVFGSIYSLGGTRYANNAVASREGVRKSSKKGPLSEQFVVDEKFGVELLLDLQSSSSSSPSPTSATSYALGPHSARLQLRENHGCLDIRFWLQFEGDAMGTVILTEQEAVAGTHNWDGEFYFPTSGTYQLVSYFYGCGDSMGTTTSRNVLKEGVNVAVETGAIVDTAGIPNPLVEASNDPYLTSILFPNAAWVASHKFGDSYSQNWLPYVWHNPSATDANFIKMSATMVSKEGAVFSESGFFAFPKLSNYELVCWIGSTSAFASREAFFELRSKVSPNQRPFKFHYYNTTSFMHPTENWPESEQSRFRKCKHLLVSLDEIRRGDNNKPPTQQQYADQVTVFLHHLEKAFSDETFPIWMFTVSESPIAPSSCVAPYYLPRTSHHPCNDALFNIFRESGDPKKPREFSKRVHLLDNTKISLPPSLLQIANGNIQKQIVDATIALRIFALVGKKVQEWRAAGQHGQVDGLHRGGVMEPNIDLVPYTGWL